MAIFDKKWNFSSYSTSLVISLWYFCNDQKSQWNYENALSEGCGRVHLEEQWMYTIYHIAVIINHIAVIKQTKDWLTKRQNMKRQKVKNTRQKVCQDLIQAPRALGTASRRPLDPSTSKKLDFLEFKLQPPPICLDFSHANNASDDWCWFMMTGADWCWLMPFDPDWCWLVLIDANLCWLILIDATRWLWMLIDADDDWWCLMLIYAYLRI